MRQIFLSMLHCHSQALLVSPYVITHMNDEPEGHNMSYLGSRRSKDDPSFYRRVKSSGKVLFI